MSGRDLLVFLAIKYSGEYELMLKAIKEKEKFEEKDVEETLKNIKSKYVTILDEEYPSILKQIYMPPLVLFYYGDFSIANSDKVKVAVVGSRENSIYGEKATIKLCQALSKSERVIVSGLARGIDSIAHKSAIEAGGKTIAVLGSGIDYCYPTSNKKIYEEIKKNHLVVSEYPNKTEPTAKHFPNRNRIVAGLADKVLVTEAYKNSGTNITVLFALKQGKDVMAVPYEIGKDSACNRFIQDGAYLVESVEDVIYMTEKKY